MAKKGPDWLDDDDLFDDDEGDIFEEDDVKEEAPTLKRGGSRRSESSRDSERKSSDRKKEKAKDRKADSDDAGKEDDGEKKESLAHRLAVSKKRPGEQEILKSPLVLGLGGGTAVLIVVAGAFWFIIGRDTVKKQLDAVEVAIQEQRYNQAITTLDEFLLNHGRDKYTEPATLLLAKTRIDKEIGGSAPDWEKGLDAIRLYIDDCRDFDSYADQYPMLAEYSTKIALGSLETAAQIKNRKLLDISEEADLMIDRFSDPENPPVEIHDQVKLAREKAIDAIRKYEATKATYEEIEKLLAAKRPIDALASRRRLLDRYPDLAGDRKLAAYLEDTLETERGLVKTEDVDRPASTEDRELPVPAPLSLTLHTRAGSEVSEGRTVFAVAQGCCYGLDTITGDPVWRRSIGPDTPFFPIKVDTTVPGLILFDTVHSEIVLINRLTGDFVWRQPLDESVSGAIVEHEGQLYVPTLGNHLYKLDLQSGRISTRLTFSQPVYSPPVLTRDGGHLIVSGHEAVSYTLGMRPLECLRVSFTKQKPGSIEVPMLPMGELVLMIENDQSSGATLRILDARESESDLPEVASLRLGAHVRDVPLLRGNRLYVPAVGEQINIFTISDELDKEPLAVVARPPAQSEYSGAVHLLAGADNLVWTASDQLRQYQLTQDALLEDAKKKQSIGASAQPIQSIGRTLFVGRRQLESDAVSMAQYDGVEMESEWRTVVGGGLLAMSQPRDDLLVCLTRSGDLFQVGDSNLEAGGFQFRAEGTLGLPEDLSEPLRATILSDNQIAAVAGGRQPRMWIINQAGKVGQEFPLGDSPVADPVPIAGGAVVALPTKLRTLGASAGRVEDFLGDVGQDESVQWSSLVPLDENHVIAIDREGKITRLQFRTSPSPHLQQVDSLALGEPVDVQPVVADGKLYITDAGGKVQMLNVVGFERIAEAELDAPAVGVLGLAGQSLLVETSRGKLHCLDTSKQLAEAWSIEFESDHLTGAPIVEKEAIILATMNGRVLLIDRESGDIKQAVQLDQSLEHGPLRFGSHLLVTSIDGSIYRIESITGGNQ